MDCYRAFTEVFFHLHELLWLHGPQTEPPLPLPASGTSVAASTEERRGSEHYLPLALERAQSLICAYFKVWGSHKSFHIWDRL